MSGSPDLVAAAFHWIEDLGLLAGVGSFVVRRLGRMQPRVAWANPPMHIAFASAVVGGAWFLLTTPSILVGIRSAAEVAALVLCLRGNRFVAPFAVLAAGMLATTGHASGAGAQFAEVLHVLSAGMWAGGILALASLRPPAGWGSPDARVMFERFGRVAIIAFGVTALTGALRATEQLNDLSQLWTTTYGAVLTLKVAGVLLMIAVSALWRRGLVGARWDAAVTAIVVGLTGVLAAFPLQA